MAPFGSSDDDLHRRVAELEHRVAALERALGRAPPGEPSEAWASEGVRRLVMEGNKIGAMKLLGEETGVGLRQAKDIVDRLSEQLKP
jgi:large subunit ribosomal protein L7/L12